ISALLPVLIPLVKLLAGALGVLARGIVGVVNVLIRMVGWLQDAVAWVQRLLNKIPQIHIPDIHLPFISSSAAGVAAGRPGVGARSLGAPSGFGSPSASSAGVVVNVYGAIDPEGTARAVRRVLAGSAMRTGKASPLLTGSALG